MKKRIKWILNCDLTYFFLMIVIFICLFIYLSCRYSDRKLAQVEEEYPVKSLEEILEESEEESIIYEAKKQEQMVFQSKKQEEILKTEQKYVFAVEDFVVFKETELETEETQPSFTGYDFIPLEPELQHHIKDTAEEYGVDFNIVLAVIWTESNFDCDVIGDNGNSIGLMQVQPKWWKATADSMGLDFYNPYDNTTIGIYVLKYCLDRNGGDYSKALKEYNSGNPNYPKDDYLNSVMGHYHYITQEAGDVM